MERKNSYNLMDKKDEFVNLLKNSDLNYDSNSGMILGNYFTYSFFVGRILDSNPPYLVIFSEEFCAKEKEKSISKLIKLADEFRID